MKEKEIAAACYARAGGKCEGCGKPEPPKTDRERRFDLHHKDGRYGGEHELPPNREVLCQQCHVARHPRKKANPPRLFRLTDADVIDLETLAQLWRCSEAEAARRAIREAARREKRKGAE